MSQRNGKRIAIGARPPANPHAEAWVRQGDADGIQKGDLYTARLTLDITPAMRARIKVSAFRSEEHTSELQSLMRISYAVFCLKKKKQLDRTTQHNNTSKKVTLIDYTVY